MAAFERNCVFKGRTMERSIRGKKECAFPIVGRMAARYYTPGTAITGSTNAPSDLNELIIRLDGKLIADYSFDNLDDMMSEWDYRSPITTELGRALAVERDKRVARIAVATALKTTSPLGKPLNSDRTGDVITLPAAYTNAATTKNVKGNLLVDAIGSMIVAKKSKDVPLSDMYLYLGPNEVDFLQSSDRGINADWNGGSGANGTFAEGGIRRVLGLPIIETNHVTQPPYTLDANFDRNPDYATDLSKCKAIVLHKSAVGVLTLQDIMLTMTAPSGDYSVMFQAQLMVSKMAIGIGSLRYEAAGAIFAP
jgi:hypothetical protein